MIMSTTRRNNDNAEMMALGKDLLDSDPDRAVVLLSPDRRVVYANPASQTLLRDGTPRGADGLLPASMDEWLRRFLERMQTRRAPMVSELHYPSEDERRLRVTFESRWDEETPYVVIRAYPATPWLEPSVRRLQGRYGLTVREAQVAAGVSKGHTNAEVADKLGIREKTVKNVLMSVFDKCVVRNRVELALRAYDAPVGTLEPRV